MPNYAEIAVPLTDLTKKGKSDKLKWEEAQQNSYRTLKTFLAKPPILRLPDKNKTYILNSFNASPPGRGGHGNQLLYGPRAGGVTLGFHFGISSDRLLKFAACFH